MRFMYRLSLIVKQLKKWGIPKRTTDEVNLLYVVLQIWLAYNTKQNIIRTLFFFNIVYTKYENKKNQIQKHI